MRVTKLPSPNDYPRYSFEPFDDGPGMAWPWYVAVDRNWLVYQTPYGPARFSLEAAKRVREALDACIKHMETGDGRES